MKSKMTKEEFPQFYPPKLDLKIKVGHGGVSKETILKAQKVIDTNKIDFVDVAAPYMVVLSEGISIAKKSSPKDTETIIEGVLFPAMQLKANGDLFHYPLVTHVASQMLYFLERIESLNGAALDIVDVFQASINLIFKKRLKGEINPDGDKITSELDAVCARFLEKYPDNIHPRFMKKNKKSKK